MISDVRLRGSTYSIYDTSGKQIAFIPNSAGILLGTCIDFIILENGGLFLTFDERGNRIASLSTASGNFINATGNSFNLEKNGLITSYDNQCQKMWSRTM